MTILFLHGAGGYAEDRALADRLAVPMRLPQLPDDDLSYTAWSERIAQEITLESPDVHTVIGHSFGASTVLKMLAEGRCRLARLVLLATPDWSPAGWDVADYALTAEAASSIDPAVRLDLHHCADDDIVPIEHLDRLAGLLPQAGIHRYVCGGHQFAGSALQSLAATLPNRP